MAIGKETLKQVYELVLALNRDTEQYCHSRPVAVSKSELILYDGTKHSFNVAYSLRDILAIGAITQSSVLMTGGTDKGKTTLAKLVMNSFFGLEEKGWHRIDIDNDFGKDTYADVDFSIIKEGRKLSEGMYSRMGFLELPGLILDEINRAHASINTKLLHVFDKDISLPDGSRARIGCPTGTNGQRYQFQIAAINEGKEYAGVFDMDKAMRRRTTIEIPMDVFPPTPFDLLCIQKNPKKQVELNNDQSRLENILQIYNKIDSLTLHPTAELFVAYLQSFDYCMHSFTGDKGGIASKNGSVRHVCAQPVVLDGQSVGQDVACKFLRTFEDELCPNVSGLSAGVSQNLINVAKGFALLRANKFAEAIAGFLNREFEKPLSYSITKPDEFRTSLLKYAGTPVDGEELGRIVIGRYFDNLQVEIGDIEAAMTFVGYSKIGMCGLWVEKKYQGNRNEAIKFFCREARSKLEEGLASPDLSMLSSILSGDVSREELLRIKSHCENENPWLWRTLMPYFEDKEAVKTKPKEVLEFYSQ